MATVEEKLHQAFADVLWPPTEKENTFPAQRPLLAHYTSIATLECIMKNDELWLANPLYMNDLEELRFGIVEAAHAFRVHEGIRNACKTAERYDVLQSQFENYLEKFSNDHAFDTYVVCFSEHTRSDTDGLLSMWRGYGGNGCGAAIVFDTSKLTPVDSSPLILAKVEYANRIDRLKWIQNTLDDFAAVIDQTMIPTELMYVPVYALIERFKQFALFTKHNGFSEEKEWRLAYIKEKDRGNFMEPFFHYVVGKQGIEPKLKFKVGPINGVTDAQISLVDFVDQIILGPSVSSALSVKAVQRMLEKIDKKSLSEKLVASTTPFRAAL